jgi:hypothetical protein
LGKLKNYSKRLIMDAEKKFETEIKLQVALIISRMPGMPPNQIEKHAIPLSKYFLGHSQRLPLGTENTE